MVNCKFLVLLPLMLGACSAGKFTGDNASTTPFVEQTYLTLVGFTGSVVKREKRFSGYSKSAQRVSLINPSTETEVWGRQLSGSYDMTAPLPDYSGIAMLSDKTLTVVTETSEKVFTPIDFQIGYVARATDSATYAAVSLDGQAIHVIRSLGNGDWQEETIASPFVEPPDFAAPPGEEPPLGIALLSSDGARLVFFKPSDGRYAYYAADPGTMKINPEPQFECNGDGVGRTAKATFRAITYDGNLVVTGDRHGVVSVFNPAAPCVAVASRPVLDLGENFPITDVTQAGVGRIAVTQVGGRLHTVNYSTAGFAGQKLMTDVCNYPLGALPVGQDGIALVCIDAQNLATPEQQAEAPAAVKYQHVTVQLVSLVSGLPIFERPVAIDGTAGVALDPDLGRVLTLRDSSIGILDVLDLASGEQHTRRGLFLGGILD